jgi:hypothetical protein
MGPMPLRKPAPPHNWAAPADTEDAPPASLSSSSPAPAQPFGNVEFIARIGLIPYRTDAHLRTPE